MEKGSATKALVSALGAITGIAGIEHGVGEVLQGNVAPGGMTIVAWPGSELFSVLAGEPAMTIVPNLLVTGLLAIATSLAFFLCATIFVDNKRSRMALLLLPIAMLLLGAGFGSAALGLIVGLTATRINTPLAWWHSYDGLQRSLGRLWPGIYVVCIIAWLLLLPGTVILGYVFGVDSVTPVVPFIILLAFGSMALAILTGFAYDLRRHDENEGRLFKHLVGVEGKSKA
jgi:hypothetical protein